MNDIQLNKLKKIISANPMRNHPKITSIATRTINHPSFAQNVTHSLETISHLNLESIIKRDDKTLMCNGREVHTLRPFKVVSNIDISANNDFSTSFRLYVESNKPHYEQQADVSQKSLLSDEALYGGKLRRYSRSNAAERWCIISYIIDDKLYKSKPIRIKNTSKPTEWLSELTVEFTESLKPKFSWNDGAILENQQYFQVISKGSNVFVSGTFTTDKYFQFYDTSNVTSNINIDTPVDLVLGDEYNFTLMGLSSDNWVNLIIQKSFTVE